MTDCVISVVHLTTPSHLTMGECTLTALAVISTVLLAVILTCPPAFMSSSQPLLCLSVTLKHSNGCELVINAAGQVKITANSTVEISASAVNVHAPMVKCDGVVKCTTLITQSVISPLYTPGAGNVW